MDQEEVHRGDNSYLFDIRRVGIPVVNSEESLARPFDAPDPAVAVGGEFLGGFPGIPLAILFPECSFQLIDSIGKKIKVVTAVSESIGLTNVTAAHRNVVEEKGKYDFVLSRGVMNTGEFIKLVRKNVKREPHNSIPNGLLMLKGGDLSGELAPFRREALTWDISDYFEDEFFEKKKLVFIPVH